MSRSLPDRERRRGSPSRGEPLVQMCPRDWEHSANREVSALWCRCVLLVRATEAGLSPLQRPWKATQSMGLPPRPEATREAHSPKTREHPTATRHSQPVHGHGHSAMQQKVAPGGVLQSELLGHSGETLGALKLGKWDPEAEQKWRHTEVGHGVQEQKRRMPPTCLQGEGRDGW